jgi:Fe-S-cluster containining protein
MSPISLLPHEEVVLKRLAQILGVDVEFSPGYRVYEAISGVNLALSYVMHLTSEKKCPFLVGNKCSIHYIYKPYICRSFPYIPKHVRYSIDETNKYITASADYGVSLACHIIKKDREWLERLGGNSVVLYYYLKNEYMAAREAENVRALFLSLLSKLWRDGLVELQAARENAPVANLYELLRQFYPDLPNVIGIDKVVARVRNWAKNY